MGSLLPNSSRRGVTAAIAAPDDPRDDSTPRVGAVNARWLIFCGTVFVLVVLAVVQVIRRVRFPWDVYLWSESPFLTNMLKLTNGIPLYTDPADANSFVYSPGLEFITYSLLRPFRLQLDIRYCRAVSIFFSIVAAVAFGWCASILRRAHFPHDRDRLFPAVATGLVFLVIHQSYTSDVPHPDNIYMAHAGVTLLLVLEALRRGSPRLEVTAILVGSLGVFFKQVAALSAVGACLALVFGNFRGVAVAARLGMLAIVSTAVSVAALWSIPWCKFYTFDVLLRHGFAGAPFRRCLDAFSFQEHRWLPLLLCTLAVWWVLRRWGPSVAKYWVAVLMLFLFESCPTLSAYLKQMGSTNNLTILEVGMVLVVLPWLYALVNERRPSTPRACASLMAAFLLTFCYNPPKAVPLPADHRFCGQIQYAIARDLRDGKRVLLAHCTEFLIRNGWRTAPIDRANSFMEIRKAGQASLTGTQARIESRAYDKIYLNTHWFGPILNPIIERNYREVRIIRTTAPLRKGAELGLFNDGFLQYTRVLEPIR